MSLKEALRKRFYILLFPAAVVVLALVLGFVYGSTLGKWTGYFLAASILIGSLQLFADFLKSARSGRIDIGSPILLTIIILAVLGNLMLDALFVLLILFGQIFREYVMWRTDESISSISRSLPDNAFVKQAGGIVEVKISEIKAGDIIAIKNGARVPVDGILLSKQAFFDESVISGESKPVGKQTGSNLVAGSINMSDYVEMHATNTSTNSTIALIRKLVSEAQSRHAPLSNFTNRYAQITSIVAAVLVVASFFIWHDVVRALALWVALVPIIFAIIVPVATTIGISMLAKRGILVKSAEALESLTKADTVVFDKTGTLTYGSPQITGIATFSWLSEEELLRLAASIEKYSEHSIAIPIVRLAADKKLKLISAKDVHVEKGKGISARCNNKLVYVGRRKFLELQGIKIPHDAAVKQERMESEGNSSVFVGVHGRLYGMIFIADRIREDAVSAISELNNRGIKTIILTGDSSHVAASVGKILGVREVYSELMPEDKVSYIKRFKSEGRKVVMVGDGINDAPALAEADIGIAMGLRGVDITLESSQVVLVNDNIGALPNIVLASKRIFRIIRNDLYIASGIHLLAAVLVVVGIIGMLGSIIAHQVSSAIVLLNTMQLFWVNPP